MQKSVSIIVEPWFTASGHPPQSLLNTARALSDFERIIYLASIKPKRDMALEDLASTLSNVCNVRWFRVPNSSLAVGTLLAIFHISRIARDHPNRLINVFFLDAQLLVLATALPLLRKLAPNVHIISALMLWGPEGLNAHRFSRNIVKRYLRSHNTKLFLRTEELAEAWRNAFAIQDTIRIDSLPSLEVCGNESAPESPPIEGPPRFGIFGQIRASKGIEWLVPLFISNPQIGSLRIVGKVADSSLLKEFPDLRRYPEFTDRFTNEQELISLAASVDYLLILYDHWDHRMEAATFYLAARTSRPIICYANGWCGRIVTNFNCGIAADPSTTIDSNFFTSIPNRSSTAYSKLVDGMRRFRIFASAKDRTDEFVRKIGHDIY